MTQPINRETAIALAKEVGFKASVGQTVDDTYHPDRNAIGKSVPVEWVQRFYDLAVAHSRKDAEPVGICGVTKHGGVSVGWMPDYIPQHNDKLYLHPPEADKLLQQALEALERATAYLLAGTANGKHPDALADVRLHKKTITAIRTYRENKA